MSIDEIPPLYETSNMDLARTLGPMPGGWRDALSGVEPLVQRYVHESPGAQRALVHRLDAHDRAGPVSAAQADAQATFNLMINQRILDPDLIADPGHSEQFASAQVRLVTLGRLYRTVIGESLEGEIDILHSGSRSEPYLMQLAPRAPLDRQQLGWSGSVDDLLGDC